MKQMQPLTITNAQLVTPAGIVAGALRCAEGVIVGIGQDVAPAEGDAVVNARGKLLAPGLIDCGVFAVDKPAFHFGGITRAALMPDQSPPLDLPSRVNFIAKSGKPDLWVHPLAAATRGLEGRELAEIALMQDAGARGIATGRRWIADSG
ncbi:MAG: dihydroorotase, partial [Erythrobacter sp.]|nr:dihydroorotase [Erythrobacter sp.]